MPKIRRNKNVSSNLFDANETLVFQAIKILQEINMPSPYDNSHIILKKFGQIDNDKPRRSPNSFLLYRAVVTHILAKRNIYLAAEKISRIASEKWKNESNSIKEEYIRFAEEIKTTFLKDANSPSKRRLKFRYDKHCSSASNKYCELTATSLEHKFSPSNFSVIDSTSFQEVNADLTISETPSTSTEILPLSRTELGEYDNTTYYYIDPALSYENTVPTWETFVPAMPMYIPNFTSFPLTMNELESLESLESYLQSFHDFSMNDPENFTISSEQYNLESSENLVTTISCNIL
ncbi:13581_t:CDS:1 [Ambispora leptoticha]|uniref:13581_t:CDS:1 n=1 Tax=Ambispora leptoticha TaxID=144679 RepID=A0A9N9CVQ0_9GLOM|nr:13581_t:CDS:1 [Ambispora leptoticha]